jgi:hypothetical protein
MATGDIRWFAQALHDLGNKIHDLDGDALRVGLITSAATPAIGATSPHWGGTGTTNFATSQVATGTAYATGGPTLASVTWSVVSSVPTLRAAILTIAQDASGFTNARWGIVYNNTDANKRAIAFIDLGSDRSIVGGALTIDWSGANNDILTITQPA